MTIEEYNKCVDDFADAVYRFVLKQIKDKHNAKDIVQDTFEKMWIKMDSIEYSKSKSHLFTAAYHTLIDFIRKQKKQTNFSEIDFNQHSHNKQYSDLKQVLDAGLEQLPEIQKAVILLRDYEGYDYKEIGEITNLNESQVKVYIFRARNFLKNYIGKMEVVL